MNDLKFAFRQLVKNPGFTIVAVLTLAFGIGVNTSIFSMVSAFFLQPLPVREGERLMLILQRGEVFSLPYGHSYPDYVDYRDRTTVFSELAALLPNPVHLSAAGQTPERTWIELVSPNYFELAGVNAAWGRVFGSQAGDGATNQPVIVLNHQYWQRRFGGDVAIIGRTVNLNGHPFTVIGVTPEHFAGLEWALAVSGFVPAPMAAQVLPGGEDFLRNRGAPAWRIMGRPKPGVRFSQARAAVQVVAKQLAAEYPEHHKNTQVVVIPEQRARPDPSFSDFLPLFAVLFVVMVGLVLFIACANVANLMFSRAIVRHKELVMRAALGASRWRLVRQLLVESMVLALTAGVVGFVLGQWVNRALAGFTPASDMPINTTQHPWDWRIYVFTLLIALVAGVATGIVPALKASRFELFEALKEGTTARRSSTRHRFRNLLVVSQVTLSLVVLICAGLFLHSLREVKQLELGFRPDHVLMLSLDLGLQQYSDDKGRQFCRQLVERVKALPGVQAASLVRQVPFDYSITITDVAVEGGTPRSKDGYLATSYTVAGQDYLQAAGISILRGRDFTEQDNETAPRVAIINEVMAQQYWPGVNPLGKRFRQGRDGPFNTEVIGIAANGKYVFLAEEPRPYYYLPLAQSYTSPLTLFLRTAADPRAFVQPVRQVVNALDPDLPVFNVRTMDQHIREAPFALMPIRMGATMAGFQGVIGLLLAVMGIYAVVSYAARQRTQEIGIRMALGARSRDVVRLVVREGLRLTLIGIGIGLVGAFAIAFVLSRLLYGVSPANTGVFLGVTVLLLAVAALACYLPVRRATRVDPVVALRYE